MMRRNNLRLGLLLLVLTGCTPTFINDFFGQLFFSPTPERLQKRLVTRARSGATPFSSAPGIRASTAASGGSLLVPGVIRQVDCSLTLVAIDSSDNSVAVIVPDFQVVLHDASGLTTQPDLFPGGCDDSAQGRPGDEIVGLGRLANGNALAVAVNPLSNFPQITVVQGNEQVGQVGSQINIDVGPSDQSFVDFAKRIAAGDFNGDGVQDLAVTVDGANPHVAVLLGAADGTFATPVDLAAAAGVSGITVADFNGDRHPDIAFQNGLGMPSHPDGILRVLLGNGDGTFQAPIDGPAVTGNLAAADFDGDGKPDLVDSKGNVLLGQGGGLFTAVADSGLPASGRTDGIGVGDLNLDGNPDVVLNHFGNAAGLDNAELLVFLGNGDGTFNAIEPHSEPGHPPHGRSADTHLVERTRTSEPGHPPRRKNPTKSRAVF